MSNRVTTSVLALLVVVLGATSFWLWRALDKERKREESQPAQSEILPPARMTATNGASCAEPATPSVTGGAGSTGEPAIAEGEVGWSMEESELLRDPAYFAAARRISELELRAGYFDLADALGISMATADRLIELVAEQGLRNMELYERAHESGPGREAWKLERARIQQTREAEIATIIGAAKLDDWLNYVASDRVRHQVRELGAELYAKENPLRGDQAGALVEIIHGERSRAKRELADYSATLAWSDDMQTGSHRARSQREAELTRMADDNIRKRAGKVLNREQAALLGAKLGLEREMQEAELERIQAVDALASLSEGGG